MAAMGQYNPHLHIIATSGGGDPQASQWVHLDYLPYPLLRKKWQWHLLTMLRQTLKTKEINRLVDACYTRYREGFVTNGQKGRCPVTFPELGDLPGQVCRESTDLAPAHRPL